MKGVWGKERKIGQETTEISEPTNAKDKNRDMTFEQLSQKV